MDSDVVRSIVYIEDDPEMIDLVSLILSKRGFQVKGANGGRHGLDLAKKLAVEAKPALILLDLMMPEVDGRITLKNLREITHAPVIVVSALIEKSNIVELLNMGSDDYITKPFGMRELIARVKANIRRLSLVDADSTNGANTIYAGKLTIDLDRYEVMKEDKVIELTLREFELLKFLATQANQIFTREQLLKDVWGYEYFGDIRTVDVTVRRLREKVEDDSSEPTYILTKRGVGYYFKRG